MPDASNDFKPNILFSFVIPVFNRAKELPRALNSILMQDFGTYEIIVVDDASTDHLESVIASYKSAGIIYLKNERNLGVGPSRNRGVRVAHGEWIVFLDSDNYLLPQALAKISGRITECDQRIAAIFGRSQSSRSNCRPEPPDRQSFEEFILARFPSDGLPVARRDILLRFPFDEGLGTRRECGCLVWNAIARAGYDYFWTRDLVQYYEVHEDSLSGKSYISSYPEEMIVCNERMIELFGEDLLRLREAEFILLQQKTAFYCIMAGRYRRALKHAWEAFKCDSGNFRTILLFPLCVTGSWVARRIYGTISGPQGSFLSGLIRRDLSS